MPNFLRIPDCVTFSLTSESLVRVQDDFGGVLNPVTAVGGTTQAPRKGLLVKIAASHAGIITRNNGFYLPDKMRKGVSSFTDNYGKPILLHHEDHKDPVGRIVQASYVDTSALVKDRYNGLVVKDRFGKEMGTITEQLISDFVDGKLPFGAQVDVIRSLLKDSILEDPDYAGLGYAELVANITDPQAIQNLLDGIYLTGSVGASTDKAVCSVCKQDWTGSAGRCEHRPGGVYDGVKCFIIAGALSYDEYSFVNVPADRHSKVLQLNCNGVQENVEILNQYSGRVYEANLGFPQYDSVNEEERSMVEDAKKEEATQAPASEPEQNQPEGTQVADAVPAPEAPVLDEAEVELVRLLDAEKLSDEDEAKLYDLLWAEAEKGFQDGEFTLEQLEVEKLEDAKLSPEKRKSLAGSTFCGPERSFPVPDCAHVTAARRLVGRYKGPGDKSKILACVSRKAKALGCETSKKDEAQATVPAPAPVQDSNAPNARFVLKALLDVLGDAAYPSDDPVLDEEDRQMLKKLVKKLANLSTKDAVEALIEDSLAVAPDCYQAVLDEVVALEEKMGNLRDKLSQVATEYQALQGDVAGVQDALVKEKEGARKLTEEYVSLLAKVVEPSTEVRDFSVLETDVLAAELTRLTDKVDMTKIVDKLGDGTSREPTETVDNPTEVLDIDQKSELTRAELLAFEEQYMKLQFTNSYQAEQFRVNTIRRWKMEGRKVPGLPDTQGGNN